MYLLTYGYIPVSVLKEWLKRAVAGMYIAGSDWLSYLVR